MAGGAGPLPEGGLFKTKGPLIGPGFLFPYALVTSLFFLWGFAYGLLDVLNKHFQNVLDISKLQSTGLQVAYFGIGYLCFSPVAAEVMKRFGYKKTIIMGLGLYSLGAILFWPVAHFSSLDNKTASFAGFVVCTGVVACGLATLEVSANSYVTVMPPGGTASLRLQFSQSWNGVASFTGPLIASKFFFSGGNEDNLTNVQFVYMAVAGLGVLVATLFFFTKLPEVSEAELQEREDALALATGAASDPQLAKPFIKQVRPILGFVAQFCYVGAQVTIGAFFINYATESAGLSDAKASTFLSYSLIIFTVFRFVSTALLAVFSPAFLLVVFGGLSALLVALIGSIKGQGGLICLMLVYACMACQYPIIFVLSTERLGRHTRRAAGLLVVGVAGGAVFPPVQGAIAGTDKTRVSMWLSFPAFIYVAGFAFWCWIQKGRKITRKAEQQFVDDLAASRAIDSPITEFVPQSIGDEDEKKIAAEEDVAHVENVTYSRV